MAPKRPAAAASGSASDASDAGADASRRRRSPSPIQSSRSRSPSKTPPPKSHPNANAFSLTPASAAAAAAIADFEAASDSDADGRAPSPRRGDRGRSPRHHSDSDAGGRGRSPSPKRYRRRSPRPHSDSDAGAGGRSPSPRRDRSPGLHSDSDAEAEAAAAAASEDDGVGAGNASSPPRSRRSSRIESSNIKPISTRAMDSGRREVADSSQQRSRRPHSSRARHSPEHSKRPPRVWSPEDEITILRALIAYRGKKGLLPGSIQDTAILHDQIRGQLTSNATTTQLSDKVRRLKHKFKSLVSRARNGRDPVLPMAHDREFYDLGKKVWGKSGSDAGEVGGSHAYETAGDAESDEEQEIEESDEDMEGMWEDHDVSNKKLKAFRSENGHGNAIVSGARTSHGDGSGRDEIEKGKQMYPYLWEAVEELSKEHPSGSIFRKAFAVLVKSKARAMEDKLRKFRMSEIRQQLHRMDLLKETVTMVLDALEGAN
ncbi:hypothetical protein ACP70R_001016 [Stipagrostis hirtigluma subsp. patula]